MNSGQSITNAFAVAFSFKAKTGVFAFAKNFPLVFPKIAIEIPHLDDLIKVIDGRETEFFRAFFSESCRKSQLFTTFSTQIDGQKYASSAWILVNRHEDEISGVFVNISPFMPDGVLHRDMIRLFSGLNEVRKITHDLNNQFQIIAGYGSTLADELANPDQKECADSIVTAVNAAISHNVSLRKLFPPKNNAEIFVPAFSAEATGRNQAEKRPAETNYDDSLMNVMVVDDEPLVQRFLCDMLKRLKLKAVGFSTGKQALDQVLAKNCFYKIAVLDMNLPDIPTEEIFRAFRDHSPETRVILISGESQGPAASQMLELGARGYLQKPTSVKTLSELIKRIVAEN